MGRGREKLELEGYWNVRMGREAKIIFFFILYEWTDEEDSFSFFSFFFFHHFPSIVTH